MVLNYQKFSSIESKIIISLRLHVLPTPFILHRQRQKDSPMCYCEEEIGTIDHIVFQCKKFNMFHSQFYKILYMYYGNGPFNVEFLITRQDYGVIKYLCKMIVFGNF